jgi:hypothetical protein
MAFGKSIRTLPTLSTSLWMRLKEGRGTMPDGNDPDMDKKAPKLPFGIPQPPPVGASPEETKKWVESLDDKGKDLLKEWIESLSDDELGQLLP